MTQDDGTPSDHRTGNAITAFSIVSLVATGIWILACEGEFVSIFVMPILQWIYVLPVIIWAAITRRTEVAAVFAIGGALLFLVVGVGCFAFVTSAGTIGG